MRKKVVYSTVVYKCSKFDEFLSDYLRSVFYQNDQDFELLVLIDDADKDEVDRKISELNENGKKIHLVQSTGTNTPIQLRKQLIEISYELSADILIFSDFDETVNDNRVKEIKENIESYSFVFNDFYIVDSELRKLGDDSFFCNRDLPHVLNDWHELEYYNYVGFGSLAINLGDYDYKSLIFPENIMALDWFIVTKVLLDGGTGYRLDTTFANYRQHQESYVGFDFRLDETKLKQGIEVKKAHYEYFCNINSEFKFLLNEILKLEEYIREIGPSKYINAVNTGFDTSKFCWWENIKLKNEISYDF